MNLHDNPREAEEVEFKIIDGFLIDDSGPGRIYFAGENLVDEPVKKYTDHCLDGRPIRIMTRVSGGNDNKYFEVAGMSPEQVWRFFQKQKVPPEKIKQILQEAGLEDEDKGATSAPTTSKSQDPIGAH